MRVATGSEYAKAHRQAVSEGLRAGSHEAWVRAREIIHDQGLICHSEVTTYEGDELVIVTSR
jgi:hypothetical protein